MSGLNDIYLRQSLRFPDAHVHGVDFVNKLISPPPKKDGRTERGNVLPGDAACSTPSTQRGVSAIKNTAFSYVLGMLTMTVVAFLGYLYTPTTLSCPVEWFSMLSKASTTTGGANARLFACGFSLKTLHSQWAQPVHRHTFIVSVAPNLPDQPKPVDPPHHALNAAPAYGGGGGNSYGYVPAVSAEDEASDESCVPWGPAAYKTAEPSCHTKGSLREDDRLWVEVTGLCVHFINQSFEERQRL